MQETRHKTEYRIELPDPVVEAIRADIEHREKLTECDVRDSAFDHVDRRTEFVTEDGTPLIDAISLSE